MIWPIAYYKTFLKLQLHENNYRYSQLWNNYIKKCTIINDIQFQLLVILQVTFTKDSPC